MTKILLGFAATALVAAPLTGKAPQLEGVIARARPAVVAIHVDLVAGGGAWGSGFVYDPSGYILTNHHVVEGATNITVTLSDGRKLPGEVVDFTRVMSANLGRVEDVAVVKIAATGLTTIPLRSPKPVQEGQELLVLGFPGSLSKERMTVTRGIVSAVRAGWIQTDALIVPGNSGGPVVDTSGRVIGIATLGVGYEYRFGGVMWIEKATDIAAGAKIPDGPRMRIIDVPGLEYFKPRDPGSSRYSARHVKTWRATTTGAGASPPYEFTQETDAEGDYHGLSRYNVHRPGALSVEDHDDFIANTQGFFDMSRRIDATWVREPAPPITLAELPLEAGRSWQFEETWRRENMQELAQSRGAPPRPTSMRVSGEGMIESLTDTVVVPAGTFRSCVKVTTGRELTTNLGDHETRITTVWYAAHIGEVKRVAERVGISRTTSELQTIRWVE